MIQKLAFPTLGVYLIHPAFVWRTQDILHNLDITDWINITWMSIPIVTLLVLIISYIIAVIMGRIPYIRTIIGTT